MAIGEVCYNAVLVHVYFVSRVLGNTKVLKKTQIDIKIQGTGRWRRSPYAYTYSVQRFSADINFSPEVPEE